MSRGVDCLSQVFVGGCLNHVLAVFQVEGELFDVPEFLLPGSTPYERPGHESDDEGLDVDTTQGMVRVHSGIRSGVRLGILSGVWSGVRSGVRSGVYSGVWLGVRSGIH